MTPKYDALLGKIKDDEVNVDSITLSDVTRTTWPTGSGVGAFTDTGTTAYYNGGNVGIGEATPAYELDVNGFTNTKSIHEVSKEGLVLGMNFNTENIIGTAGSETVLDSSGYNNHGTNYGATATSTGGFNGGGAFSFDGTNDYIEINAISELSLANDFSFSFWINTDVDNVIQTIFAQTLSANDRVILGLNNALLVFGIYDGVHSGVSYSISKDTLYNLTFTKNGTEYKIYIDGSEVTTGVGSLLTSSTVKSYIGQRTNGDRQFSGLIDSPQIYNRVLSADEIKALYLQRAEVGDSYVSQKDVLVNSNGETSITVSETTSADVIGLTVNSANAGTGEGYSAIFETGNVGIGTISPTSKLQVVGLPTYADNTAALSGGLTAGAFYRTSTGELMVTY